MYARLCVSIFHVKRKPQHFIFTVQSFIKNFVGSPCRVLCDLAQFRRRDSRLVVQLLPRIWHAQTNEITSMVRHPAEIFRKGECCMHPGTLCVAAARCARQRASVCWKSCGIKATLTSLQCSLRWMDIRCCPTTNIQSVIVTLARNQLGHLQLVFGYSTLLFIASKCVARIILQRRIIG